MDLRQISEIRDTKYEIRNGSAIILAIVLTTLLAIVGVIFLFSSRVDSVATSAVGDNEDLKLAVDTVVAQISRVLANDTPGVVPDLNLPPASYYDYPDGFNSWLASLEPNAAMSWPHITDLYYQLGPLAYNVPVNSSSAIIPEYQPSVTTNTPADADGDGVSDSIWVPVQDMNSSKGKTIYAAIRIIDNGGMLNINTGYKFDPGASVGKTQTDINLMAFAQRPFDACSPAEMQARADWLVQYRCGTGPNDITFYTNNVIWRYGLPNGDYTPFDISDELELRYRYLINQTSIDTRSEILKKWEIGRDHDFRYPIDSSTKFNDWKITACADGIFTDPYEYAYRHIATTYNMDRIIDPNGKKMLNINNPNVTASDVCDVVKAALLETGMPGADWFAAQIAVNLIDSIDADSNVTTLRDATGQIHFGFETPCIYISQIAQSFFNDGNTDGNSYAIELYKPYIGDPLPDANWQIKIGSNPGIPILWPTNSSFFVIKNINTNAPLDVNINAYAVDNPGIIFNAGDHIWLDREVNIGGSMHVDLIDIPPSDANGWLVVRDNNLLSPHSIKRDISLNKPVRRLWEPLSSSPSLGSFNNRYVSPDTYMIQAHPDNNAFTNIGEIGRIFRTDAYPAFDVNGRMYEREYDYIDTSVVPAVFREGLRVDINMPAFQNLFRYLTAIAPYPLHNSDPNETRIKGRININTAPWFVLAQLPWVSYRTPNYELARSIVAYRDKTIGPGNIDYSLRPGPPGFRNIGELIDVNNGLNDVNSMGYYACKSTTAPIPTVLLTPKDGVGDEFEERDVIFSRISNLVTVRSDVFTAYILVRIGQNGPQKRVIAILDRSNVTPAGGKVKIVAIQPVPDPR
jgi:hypothetical protein